MPLCWCISVLILWIKFAQVRGRNWLMFVVCFGIYDPTSFLYHLTSVFEKSSLWSTKKSHMRTCKTENNERAVLQTMPNIPIPLCEGPVRGPSGTWKEGGRGCWDLGMMKEQMATAAGWTTPLRVDAEGRLSAHASGLRTSAKKLKKQKWIQKGNNLVFSKKVKTTLITENFDILMPPLDSFWIWMVFS